MTLWLNTFLAAFPPWLTTILATIVPALVLAFFTAFITVRLALRRFRGEKWWERKVETYSRLVEALHSLTEYWSAQADAALLRRDIEEQREKKLSDSYAHAANELSKATGIGAFIISDEVAETLAKFQKRPQLDLKNYDWFQICDTEYDAHLKTLAEVRKLAKKDLKV